MAVLIVSHSFHSLSHLPFGLQRRSTPSRRLSNPWGDRVPVTTQLVAVSVNSVPCPAFVERLAVHVMHVLRSCNDLHRGIAGFYRQDRLSSRPRGSAPLVLFPSPHPFSVLVITNIADISSRLVNPQHLHLPPREPLL